MKMLILGTSAYDDTGQFGDFACAAIEVTAGLVKTCQRRIELVESVRAQDSSLAEVCFQDVSGPVFLDDGFLLDCQNQPDEFHDDFVNNNSAMLPDGMTLEGHKPTPIEGLQMVLRPRAGTHAGGFEIVWSAVEPATGLRVLTEAIPLDYFEQLLEAGLGPDCCDCERPGHFFSGVPGILARIVNGRLAAGTTVERCDQCERYPSDAAALEKLRKLGIV